MCNLPRLPNSDSSMEVIKKTQAHCLSVTLINNFALPLLSSQYATYLLTVEVFFTMFRSIAQNFHRVNTLSISLANVPLPMFLWIFRFYIHHSAVFGYNVHRAIKGIRTLNLNLRTVALYPVEL